MSPRLDRIGPLVIFIYNREEHRRPHVQVRGAGYRATIDIATGDVLAGSLHPRLHRQVREWIEPRRAALVEAFFAALRHVGPDTIARRFEEQTRDV